MNSCTASSQNDPPHAQLWFAAWMGARAQCQLVDVADAVDARTRFDGDRFYLPQQRLADHRAAIAHFYAHNRFGGPRFSTGSLRPIQIVLASLFEDARVEQLAMRERPGLRRLWQPAMRALDASGDDVPALLRKLARALFDPAWPQQNPWVAKACRLFLARRDDWCDAALSRELGNRLGNDLGQMRLQFNWKSYVAEPAYRDDHRGLWIDDDEPAPRDDQPLGVHIDANATAIAAAPIAGDLQARSSEVGDWLATAALPAAVTMKLPEWDYARQFYRNDWVSVREHEAAMADADVLRAAEAAMALPAIASVPPALLRRHRRSHDGDSLDIDACIRLEADRRQGADIDARIYRRREDRPIPRATIILIDTSLSMAQTFVHEKLLYEKSGSSLSRIDIAKLFSARYARQEMSHANRVAIFGFCSDGRHALHITPIKYFGECESDFFWLSKLAGLTTTYSTRLGSALRYAHRQFDNEEAVDREIIVVGDEEVSDIDSADPLYLRADAMRAARELIASGISVRYCDGVALRTFADVFH